MNRSLIALRTRLGAALTLTALALVAPAVCAQGAAQVDNSPSAQQLKKLSRRAGEKPVVAIYDFRSAVPEVQVAAAQEMFVTALVRSGAFTIAERQRLSEGVMRERQLAAQGVTSGGTSGQVAAARYVFEVVISEANAGAGESAGGLNIGGMRLGAGSASDQIGLDVRIVDAQTGLVVDAVNVVQKVEASSTSISGVANLIGSLASLRGRSVPQIPVDAEVRSSRKDGVDRALRSCIEVAVADLARRMTTE